VAVSEAPAGYVVTIKEPTRNSEQNALLWVLLTAFSAQLVWPVNGQMVKLEPEEWKDILSAAYKREAQRVAMGIDGGVVMLGLRTSKMGKRQFAEFIEFILSVAVDRGVDVEA
jgi:ABC-type Fe3+ transport system substrate-binding protein